MKRPAFYRAFPDYYDAEYAGNEMLQRDVPMFLSHLPKRRQDVLELAVGTGRAAIPIAQAGHRVVGVDLDPAMLGIAKYKRDSVGLAERHLRLQRASALKLNLKEKFDWICIFFNTFLNFTTLEQQDRLLRVVTKHLKPRGRFWLDIFYPNIELLTRDHAEHIDPGTFEVPALNRVVHRDTEVRRDLENQVQHVTYHYLWIDEHGHEHRDQIQFDLTWLFPRELEVLLNRHGLTIARAYGDHDGSPLRSNSERIIALCLRL